MDPIAEFREKMPAMLAHKGTWEGVYTHIDEAAQPLDQHATTVICEFPEKGPYAYIQRNHFRWEDGREYRAELPGIFKNDRLWWDTDTFHGSAWQTHDGLILLNLFRKDEPGANFVEIIAMGGDGFHRSRTWHWFKDGKLYKRTLCEEKRVA